jgi:hypothetical protein
MFDSSRGRSVSLSKCSRCTASQLLTLVGNCYSEQSTQCFNIAEVDCVGGITQRDEALASVVQPGSGSWQARKCSRALEKINGNSFVGA